MTIETPILQVEKYAGDGVTKTFGFGFRTFSTADVVVVATDASGVESVLNPESDFYITSNSSGIGGTVTLASALPKNAVLVITRKIPIKQEIDLVNQGEFYAETIETAFDRLTAIAQDMYEQLGRTLVVPITENSTPQQVLENILTVAATANGYAEAAKAVHEDVVVKYDEILEIKDQVEDQAAVFEGALESIENARDAAVGVVAAEGDKIKNEVGGLVDNAASIAQSVANSVATVNSAVASASASASSASSSQALASQSADAAVQAKSQAEAYAQSAEEQAKSASFAVRYLSGAVANSDFAVSSFSPNNNVKVGDHVINYTGDLFQITAIENGYATIGYAVANLRGPEGPQGIRGEKGESIIGPEGPQGIPGIQGETGEGLRVLDTFNSESQLPVTGNSGDAYFVGSDLYIWSPSQNAFVNKGQIGGGSGGITGLMSPDPRTYFLYVLNGGEVEGDDQTRTSQLNFAKLNQMVLA